LNARSNLLQDLKRAQTEALIKGCREIFEIEINATGTAYSYGCDFLSYDTDSPPSADVITISRALPRGITLITDSQIIFNSRGQTVTENDVITTVAVSMNKTVDGDTSTLMTGNLLGTKGQDVELAKATRVRAMC
jgi:hypothetical protein